MTQEEQHQEIGEVKEPTSIGHFRRMIAASDAAYMEAIGAGCYPGDDDPAFDEARAIVHAFDTLAAKAPHLLASPDPAHLTKDERAEDVVAGKAVIEGEQIVLRFPFDYLDLIVRGASDVNNWPNEYRVVDPVAFAKDLVRELNEETETGTTCVHRMFDAAILGAIEDGAFGIEEKERDDDAIEAGDWRTPASEGDET
jgi:hypothetical protein